MGEHRGAQGGGAPRILIVEDHGETAEMLSMVLQDEGYCVTLAETGFMALQMLEPAGKPWSASLHPDLIVLDLGLPDMEGAEIARRMHARSCGKRCPPVLVVSAQQPQVAEEIARSIGAAACVHKPFPIDLLLSSIDWALEHPEDPVPWASPYSLTRVGKTIPDTGLG